MPRPIRCPSAVKPRPGTTTRSIRSRGIGFPDCGSRTPGPEVVVASLRLLISTGNIRRWSQLTFGTTTGPVREPIAGKPIPLDLIDLVIVPGLGFTGTGFRIGRGMGFYDRFLAQPDFVGRSCGLAFEEQLIDNLPVLDHDVPLHMLVTDRGIRRFASKAVETGQ